MRDAFIHITDLHFWEIVFNPLRLLGKRAIGNMNVILKRRHDFLMERAEEYVAYVNSLDVEQVIITGDFASTATHNEFKRGVEFIRLLEAGGKKVSVIPGNHDVYTFISVRKKVFESYYSEWMPNQPLPCTQTLPNGTPYVFIPTVCANKLSSKGTISRAEIASTVRQVEALPARGLVIGHYPILNKSLAYKVNKNRQLRNADDLREALGETDKEMLYVCGHVHRFSDEVDSKYSNIRHLTTGAFFRTAPESNSDGDFSVVEIEDDDFQINRHVHRDGSWVSE
jgi:Icc-related predicted phosphoesterase